MTRIMTYRCDKCKYSSTDEKECLTHEARHYGLTYEQYQHWKSLQDEVRRAGSTLSCRSDPDTRGRFDDTIRAMTEWEKAHSIDVETLPKHFV